MVCPDFPRALIQQSCVGLMLTPSTKHSLEEPEAAKSHESSYGEVMQKLVDYDAPFRHLERALHIFFAYSGFDWKGKLLSLACK